MRSGCSSILMLWFSNSNETCRLTFQKSLLSVFAFRTFRWSMSLFFPFQYERGIHPNEEKYSTCQMPFHEGLPRGSMLFLRTPVLFISLFSVYFYMHLNCASAFDTLGSAWCFSLLYSSLANKKPPGLHEAVSIVSIRSSIRSHCACTEKEQVHNDRRQI